MAFYKKVFQILKEPDQDLLDTSHAKVWISYYRARSLLFSVLAFFVFVLAILLAYGENSVQVFIIALVLSGKSFAISVMYNVLENQLRMISYLTREVGSGESLSHRDNQDPDGC